MHDDRFFGGVVGGGAVARARNFLLPVLMVHDAWVAKGVVGRLCESARMDLKRPRVHNLLRSGALAEKNWSR